MKVFGKCLKTHQVTLDEHTLLVIENTGIYHRLLWLYCSQINFPIHIGNAAHIKWSFGIARGKNDIIDSIRLCNYAFKQADTLKTTPTLNPILMQLKDLMTAITNTKVEMSNSPNKVVKNISKRACRYNGISCKAIGSFFNEYAEFI